MTDSVAISGNTISGVKPLSNNRVLEPSQTTQKKFEQLMSSVQDKVEKLAQEISERGYFKNKGEADWLYLNNNNPNLTVNIDASKLTVDINHGKGWYNDRVVGGQGTWGDTGHGETFNSDFQIHGTVTVNKSDGEYKIIAEQYDFEMKSWLTHPLRNIKTFIAEPSPAGVGTPYWISYRGAPQIEITK